MKYLRYLFFFFIGCLIVWSIGAFLEWDAMYLIREWHTTRLLIFGGIVCTPIIELVYKLKKL